MKRKIACIARTDLNESFQLDNLMLITEWKLLEKEFSNIQFIEKSIAETDENYKQIIPYAILRNTDAKIAMYRRAGSEGRLHGLWSAGFGGHIETYDYNANDNLRHLVEKSLQRELREEYADGIDYNLKLIGLINEEQTKVGRTHIALVFSVLVDDNMFATSAEISAIEWVNVSKVDEYNIELWSEMAIKLITM